MGGWGVELVGCKHLPNCRVEGGPSMAHCGQWPTQTPIEASAVCDHCARFAPCRCFPRLSVAQKSACFAHFRSPLVSTIIIMAENGNLRGWRKRDKKMENVIIVNIVHL